MQTQRKEVASMQTQKSRRRGLVVLGLAVVVIAVALLTRESGPAAKVAAGSALELSLGESNALASCLPFDVAILADMPMAFQGTATSVDGSTVTLSVDRWFKGGDAATVSLVGEHESPALIDGFAFEAGAQYLITASDGTVNYCGFSGLATPELLAGFEAAFAG